ncbi:MAG: SusD/RagB family nutrient-binding outer membrane lipoprotein [Prevotellaceae bacterium]|nr:SusD/RagB family nutrient-binding outer membrane lipoprotein [Prevotellaceae bacterium]
MNSKIKKISTLILFACLTAACNDFEEVNIDPTKALEDQVSVEGLLNSSIADAQLTYWERDILFIRTWSWGARYIFRPIHGPQVFQDYNDYMSDYWVALAKWIYNASEAIRIGESRISKGTASPATNNYVQMARIWRAHLFSEAADMFGPYPAKEGFGGANAQFSSVAEIYEYVDGELKKAVASLNESVEVSGIYDAFHAGNMKKWKKYGNSLRLRCAMRFQRVGNTGRTRFEQALADAGGADNLIIDMADNASVAQAPTSTEDDAGSVFDCDYIGMQATTTVSNIGFGLGGIKLSDIATAPTASAYNLPAEALANAASPNEYLGMYMPDHLPNKTNSQSVGYFFDKLPAEIDPRILAVYHIPGHRHDNFYPENATSMEFPTGSGKTLDMTYTFFTATCGDYTGKTDFITVIRRNNALMPSIGAKYRRGEFRRMFFANWETCFLLAEAAVYGWNTGKTAREWYERGVRASFEYHGLSRFADEYLKSKDYNRLGTSVSFDHVVEAQPATMKRKVYGTNVMEDVVYNYPNSVAGTNNDPLTKIMTQKYIAQCPWLPQEATNDYRRTGRPFFENPCMEAQLPFMPFATDPFATDIKNVYRRVRYPFSLATKDPQGYAKALELLEGADRPETPLVWQLR